MNNGKLFNFKLYKDALKQLRVSGVVFLIIICFPIFWGGICGTQSAQNFPISVLAILSYILVAPLMTVNLFGFLNKRNASDFFHAIPTSRTCLYNTYITAIMTWIAAILFVSTALGIGYFSFQKRNSIQRFSDFNSSTINFSLPIAYKNTLLYILAMLVCALLVIGVVLIAMSLSGTLFMGFATSCIILFLPGVLTAYVNYYIELTAPFLDSKHFFFLVSSDSHNLVSASAVSFFGYSNQTIADFYTGSKILYTFVLAVIALCIGGFLFNRRNSACAGFFTIYPWIQTLSRCFCCLAVSLLPLSLVLTETLIQEDYIQYFSMPLYSSKPTVMIIIWYLIAVFVYFLFELINTKKVKSLIKAIPGLVIVALLNVMIYGIIWGVTTQAADFSPETDEIEYVIIDFSSSDSAYNSDFVSKLASEIKIEEESILNLVSQSLNEVTHKTKNKQLSSLFTSSHKTLTFGICVDSKLTYRNVFLDVGEITKVYNYLSNETTLFDNYFKLPAIDVENVVLSELDATNSNNSEIYEIYQYFLEEVDSLSFYHKKNIILNTFDLGVAGDLTEEQRNMRIFDMFVYFQYDGSAYSYKIPISPKTPRAYNQLLSVLSNNTRAYFENPERFAKDYPKGFYLRNMYGYYEWTFNPSFEEYEEFLTLVKEDLTAPTIDDEFYFLETPYSAGFIGVFKVTDTFKTFIEQYSESIGFTYDCY